MRPIANVYINKDKYKNTKRFRFGKNDGSTMFNNLKVSIRKGQGGLISGSINIPNNLLLTNGYVKGIEIPYKKDNITYYFPGTPVWLYQRGDQTKYGGSYISERQISKENTIGDNKNNYFYQKGKSIDRVDQRILDWVNHKESESW